MLEKITGISYPKRKLPYFFVLTQAFIAERILRLSSPNAVVMDVDSVRALRFKWYFDSSKAIRELGFPQTPIEASIEKSVKWLRDNGNI